MCLSATATASPSLSPNDVPTLQFSELGTSGTIPTAFITKLDQAMRRVGFFYLEGLDELIDLERPLHESAQFFERTEEEKLLHRQRQEAKYRGFVSRNEPIGTKQLREALDVVREVPRGTYNNMPAYLRDFMEEYVYARNPPLPEHMQQPCDDYAAGLVALGHRLMEAFCLALGHQPSEELQGYVKEPWWYYRMIHYPPLPKDKGAMVSATAHTDFGWLTLLNQTHDTGAALQMQQYDSDTWVPIPPKRGALIINIGDMMSRWSGGHYIARVHRVVHEGNKPRISIPFFFNPGIDSKIEGTCYGEHLARKLGCSWSNQESGLVDNFRGKRQCTRNPVLPIATVPLAGAVPLPIGAQGA